MRLLIVNADDFGLNDAATDGVVESHLAGSVTSTTLMVNAPASARAAAIAARHPGLAVGLHFNLTWGRPVARRDDVPALVAEDGAFLSRKALGWRLLSGRVPVEQVRVELMAQLARVQALGIRPTHVDSHQHVHGFGVVFDVIAGYCAQAGIPMRVPWVCPPKGSDPVRRMRRRLLSTMVSRAARRWGGRVAWNDDLGSVFDLGIATGPVNDDHYRRLLDRAKGTSFELMVHPVTSAAEMAGYTRIGAVAEAEWRYLRSGRLPALAAAAGFRLGSYRDIPVTAG